MIDIGQASLAEKRIAGKVAEEVRQAITDQKFNILAQKLGVSPEAASSTFAQYLPTVIDKLTPNGAMPDRSNLLQMGESLLSSLGKTGS